MAGVLTHMALIAESLNEQKEKFKRIDKLYLYSGAIFPDVNLFMCYRKTPDNNLSRFWHTGNNGFMFGKKMLEHSRNKYERSFSIGFMSHFILDNHVHGYLRKKRILTSVEHTVSEFFLDAEFKSKYIPPPKYCRRLINRVLKHEYPEISKHYFTSVYQKRFYFALVNNLVKRHLIIKKYKNPKNINKMFFTDWLIYTFGRKYSEKINVDIRDLINPKEEVKKKYLADLLKEYKLAKKKFQALDFDKAVIVKKK